MMTESLNCGLGAEAPPSRSRSNGLSLRDGRAIWHGLGLILVRTSDVVMAWQRRVHERSHLMTLDDRMLHDIGLNRADVEHEVAKPFWRP